MTNPEMAGQELPSTVQEQVATCIAGAEILFNSGDHDGALGILTEVREMFPESSDVLLALASQYARAGKVEQMHGVYRDLGGLASKMQGDGRLDEAMAAYKALNKLIPSRVAYANLAFIRTVKARQILAAS